MKFVLSRVKVWLHAWEIRFITHQKIMIHDWKSTYVTRQLQNCLTWTVYQFAKLWWFTTNQTSTMLCYCHNTNLSPLQTFVFTTAPSLPFMFPATRAIFLRKSLYGSSFNIKLIMLLTSIYKILAPFSSIVVIKPLSILPFTLLYSTRCFVSETPHTSFLTHLLSLLADSFNPSSSSRLIYNTSLSPFLFHHTTVPHN